MSCADWESFPQILPVHSCGKDIWPVAQNVADSSIISSALSPLPPSSDLEYKYYYRIGNILEAMVCMLSHLIVILNNTIMY